MIVWGGYSLTLDVDYNTGGRYDPSANSWTPTSLGAGVPEPRDTHVGVWTGSKMIVWGGAGGAPGLIYLASGAQYDPVTDSWTPTAQSSATPSPRSLHTTVWTGTEMIVWGGNNISSQQQVGGRYKPLSDTWTALPSSAPGVDQTWGSNAVWTGKEMIVWGGDQVGTGIPGSGGRYDPLLDSWRFMSLGMNNPWRRWQHTSAWTGSQMFVWAGNTVFPGTDLNGLKSGALYCAGPCTTPPLVSPLSVSIATTTLVAWQDIAPATSYDLVSGGLQSLRSSGGNFTSATQRCLARRVSSYLVTDSAVPASGDGFWYLVRGANCGTGTYDGPGVSQQGFRDAEINASPASCE